MPLSSCHNTTYCTTVHTSKLAYLYQRSNDLAKSITKVSKYNDIIPSYRLGSI